MNVTHGTRDLRKYCGLKASHRHSHIDMDIIDMDIIDMDIIDMDTVT